MPIGAGAGAPDVVGATGTAGGLATQSCELTVLIARLEDLRWPEYNQRFVLLLHTRLIIIIILIMKRKAE